MPTIITVESVATSTPTHMRPILLATSAKFIAPIIAWYMA
jgi:hypothetical protein